MASFCVLFPAFCHGLREPDPEFQREATALESLGIPWRVANIDALCRSDIAATFKYFGETPPELLIYRGWILHPPEYDVLHGALMARGCRVLTSPAAYRRGVLFPEFYPAIADHSFPAAWIVGHDARRALKVARQLGSPPWFIKDYTKSAKETWPEGCVVESERGMARAIRALREFRGDRFEGGIVIRPLVRLRYLDEHPFGGKIHEEYRLFFFRGALISQTAYDRVGGDPETLPDYRFLGQRIDSPFFTADVVVAESGEHSLLEIGDGGVSALPPGLAAHDFYSAVAKSLIQKSSIR